MITELTAEQIALQKTVAQDWIAHNLGGDTSVDEIELRDSIDWFYSLLKLNKPQIIIADSPLAAQYFANIVGSNVGATVEDNVGTNVVANVWDSVGDNVRASVGDNVGATVGASVRASVRANVGASVGDNVGASVRNNVWNNVWNTVWNTVGATVGANVRNNVSPNVTYFVPSYVNGWSDSYFAAYVAYFLAIPGAITTDRSDCERYVRFLRCGTSYAIYLRGTAIVSRRPELVKRHTAGLLHCTDGPAVRYRDGYSVYAIHGTVIPPEWIEDKASLTPEIALTWPNIEQRRVAAELIGWSKILDGLQATTIDRNPDPEIGTLLQCDLPDSPGEKFLKVQCGTGRSFVLPVPPDMITALQANAWTYGLDSTEYKLEART